MNYLYILSWHNVAPILTTDKFQKWTFVICLSEKWYKIYCYISKSNTPVSFLVSWGQHLLFALFCESSDSTDYRILLLMPKFHEVPSDWISLFAAKFRILHEWIHMSKAKNGMKYGWMNADANGSLCHSSNVPTRQIHTEIETIPLTSTINDAELQQQGKIPFNRVEIMTNLKVEETWEKWHHFNGQTTENKGRATENIE